MQNRLAGTHEVQAPGAQMQRSRFIASAVSSAIVIAGCRPAAAGLIRKTLHDDVLFEPGPRGSLSSWAATDGKNRRTLSYKAPDGVIVRGWFYPARGPDGPTILYYYGNGGSIAESAQRAAWLSSLGYNVALFDYRGYGYSEGTPHLAPIAAAALSEYDLVSNEVGGDSLFVYGWSLGTTFAVRVGIARAIRGLILQAPPASAKEELAALRLPTIARMAVKLIPDDTIIDGIANAERIANYHGPLLVIHGSDDDIVPVAQGREVFDRCPSLQKQFVALPGRHHNDVSLGDTLAGHSVSSFLLQH